MDCTNSDNRFESFCLALTLAWGKPKGLGYAGQRRSTQVGGKKAMPTPVEDLTADDFIQIARIATANGLPCENEEQTRELYARYVKWYDVQRT